VRPQFKSANHFGTEYGLDTILRNREAKCVAQEPRADLGMCLINETSAGDQMAGDWTD